MKVVEDFKIPDGPVVTSQNDTCEENQNGKTQNVPHQQSNTDICKASPHKNVLHQECDSFSDKRIFSRKTDSGIYREVTTTLEKRV